MGLIVCPSRELARQTQEVITGYLEALRAEGAPELRSLLVMGGIDMRQQVEHLAVVRPWKGRSWSMQLPCCCSDSLANHDMQVNSIDRSRKSRVS